MRKRTRRLWFVLVGFGVVALWAANTSLLASSNRESRQVLAHRGLHQTFLASKKTALFFLASLELEDGQSCHRSKNKLCCPLMLRLATTAAMLMTQLSCSSPLTGFTCARDIDCATKTQPGMCEDNQRCSFADDSCHSGRRYGPISGEDSDQCTSIVEDASTTVAGDGGVDAMAGPDAMSGVDATSLRTLSVSIANATTGPAGTLNIVASGEDLGDCAGIGDLTIDCNYTVTANDTITIAAAGAAPSIVGGTCGCSDTPCSFSMQETCDVLGVFNIPGN